MKRVLAVIGAVFVLSGLGILGFTLVGSSADQNELAQKQDDTTALIEQWESTAAEASGEIPVTARPGVYEEFGIIYVPRWGRDYVAPILEGDNTAEVSSWHGVDHYPSTQMPGEPGNFVITGHNGRNETGRFSHLDSNEVGDLVYIETADGWYTYRLTSFETIDPSQNEVLFPVPHEAGAAPTKSILTLISCTRQWWGTTDRYVAYGDFVEFTPREAGAPADVEVMR